VLVIVVVVVDVGAVVVVSLLLDEAFSCVVAMVVSALLFPRWVINGGVVKARVE
jgi:hypothetical protein